MGRAERERGKRGERLLRDELNRLFRVECHRTQQFCGRAGDSDVTGLNGVFVESKFVDKLNVRAAVRQAVSDAKNGDVPIVCHKTSREEWLVTLRLDDLPELVSRLFPVLYGS